MTPPKKVTGQGKRGTKGTPPGKQRRGRDDFNTAVLRAIAHEVGHLCSNPDCQTPTSGPSREKGVSNVGVGAHITAAAPGGPRYDESLLPEERASSANAIWLCNTCGRLVDNDSTSYTVAQLASWKLGAIERARKALASGGRNTTSKLFAGQLELQKKSLVQHQEHHDAQVLARKHEKFSEMYSRFLEEAKAYAGAIEEYWTWMHKTAFTADRPSREAKQKAVKDAHRMMERALQPILLNDDDETHGKLRLELIRRRGLEPILDTIENQRAWSEVIHYHQLRLLSAIGQLQTSVRETLGSERREKTDKEKEFEEWSFSDARAKAEAVEKRILEQYRSSVRDAGNGARASSAAAQVRGTDEVRNRVWNVLHTEIFEDDHDDLSDPRSGDITCLYLREIWQEVLGRPVDEVPTNSARAWQVFRDLVMSCDEHTFYRIVERTGRVESIREKLQDALDRSGARNHFVDGKIVQRSSSSS